MPTPAILDLDAHTDPDSVHHGPPPSVGPGNACVGRTGFGPLRCHDPLVIESQIQRSMTGREVAQPQDWADRPRQNFWSPEH